MKKFLAICASAFVFVFVSGCETTAPNQTSRKVKETPSVPPPNVSKSDPTPSEPIETQSTKVVETPQAPKVFNPEFKFNSFDGTRTVSIDLQPMRSNWPSEDYWSKVREGKKPELRAMKIGAKWNSAPALKDQITLVLEVHSNESYYTLRAATLNIDGVMIDATPSKTVTQLSTQQEGSHSSTWYVSTKEFLVPRDTLGRIVTSECTQIRVSTLSGDIDDTVNRFRGDGDAVNAFAALFKIVQ